MAILSYGTTENDFNPTLLIVFIGLKNLKGQGVQGGGGHFSNVINT